MPSQPHAFIPPHSANPASPRYVPHHVPPPGTVPSNSNSQYFTRPTQSNTASYYHCNTNYSQRPTYPNVPPGIQFMPTSNHPHGYQSPLASQEPSNRVDNPSLVWYIMAELNLLEGVRACKLDFYLLRYKDMDSCKQALRPHEIPFEPADSLPKWIRLNSQIETARVKTTTNLERNYVFVALAVSQPSTGNSGQSLQLVGSAVVEVTSSKDPDDPVQRFWLAELKSCHVENNGKTQNLGNRVDQEKKVWTLEHALRGVLGRVTQYQWFSYVYAAGVSQETKEHMMLHGLMYRGLRPKDEDRVLRLTTSYQKPDVGRGFALDWWWDDLRNRRADLARATTGQ